MLSANFTLLDDSGADVDYVLQNYLADGSRRIATASDAIQPQLLEIKHTATGKGVALVDRHLVSFSQTKNDVNSAGEKKLVVNFTISNPRSTAFTAGEVYDLVSQFVDFVTPATKSIATNRVVLDTDKIAALLRGES